MGGDCGRSWIGAQRSCWRNRHGAGRLAYSQVAPLKGKDQQQRELQVRFQVHGRDRMLFVPRPVLLR